MKTSIFLSFFLLTVSASFCQFSPTNQKSFGGTANDEMTRYFNPNDLSYSYLIGRSYSGIGGDKTEGSYGGSDVWVVKLDANNNILWDKTIGGNSDDHFTSAIITDNSIFIGSTSQSGISGNKTVATNGGYDFWLIKMDHQGNINQQSTYGGTQHENFQTFKFSNSELFLLGSSLSGIGGNKTSGNFGLNDIWIVKVDTSSLAINSQKNIGSPLDDGGFDVEQIGSNYFIGAISETGIGNDKTDTGFGAQDIWLIKLDLNLNVLGNKCFGGVDIDGVTGVDMCQLNNELYIVNSSYSNLSGNKSQNNFGSFDGNPRSDCWILKVDPISLTKLWDIAYGGTNDEVYPKISAINANQLVVSIWTKSLQNTGNVTEQNYGLFDTKFVVINTNGDLINQFTLGGSLQDYVTISHVQNNTVYFSGYSDSGISGNKTVGTNGQFDAWISQISVVSLSLIEQLDKLSVVIFPNPSEDYISIKGVDNLDIQFGVIRIVDMRGLIVSEINLSKEVLDLIYIGDFAKGTYILDLNGNRSTFVKN